MSRPSAYATLLRTLMGPTFVAGSFVHLRFGLTDPSYYGDFATTALPPVDVLWQGFVMPNIGWLALAMAGFELVVGVASWLPGWWNRLAAIAISGFFVFLVFLGYALPTDTTSQDFLVNRLGSLVMLGLVLPWLLRRQSLSVPRAWAGIGRAIGARRHARSS